MRYVQQEDQLTMVDAAFGGGRILASDTGTGYSYTPNYFITDHLGSTRAVVELTAGGTARVTERSDFYPFGARHKTPNASISDNRFRFSGKEEQGIFGLPYNDHGARMYDPVTGRWGNMDKLSEKYFGTSSFAYCLNNPVNAVDPDGRLTVFVNGFNPTEAISHGARQANRFSRPGTRMADYSTSVDRSIQREDTYGWGGLDEFYKTQYNDSNALYVSGSYNMLSKASTRYDGGVAKANELIKMLNSGEITLTEGEKIRLVGYSQGAAYAAGMASVLARSQYAHLFEFVDYVAPHQPSGFSHTEGVMGRQFGSKKDYLSGQGKRIENIADIDHYIGDFGNTGDLRGHLLGTGFNLNQFLMDVIRAGGTVTVY